KPKAAAAASTVMPKGRKTSARAQPATNPMPTARPRLIGDEEKNAGWPFNRTAMPNSDDEPNDSVRQQKAPQTESSDTRLELRRSKSPHSEHERSDRGECECDGGEVPDIVGEGGSQHQGSPWASSVQPSPGGRVSATARGLSQQHRVCATRLCSRATGNCPA